MASEVLNINDINIPSNTGLFKVIRDNYGQRILGMVRKYLKLTKKMASLKQHLNFNLRMKRYGLIPRSLHVKPLVNTQEGRNIAKRTSRSFLLARITQTVRSIRN